MNFKKAHGDRYDYSKVKYVHSKTKVIITCKEHGDFEQTPNNHSRGVNCPKCGMMNGSTLRTYSVDEILQQFKSIHGELYDYSKFEYSGNHRKSVIGCRTHGWFKQSVASHKRGSGCPMCCNENKGKNNKLNEESILKSFRSAHGDLYDYSRVKYSGNLTKVTIGCPVHGWFDQIPKDHKKGIGCAKCGPARCGKSRKVTLDEFIRRSKKHHGDRFDYSLVDLKNHGMFDKVQIICPVHGIMLQKPHAHTNGFGCKKCDAKRTGDINRIDHEEFIRRCIAKHGNKYDYSKTTYIGSHKTVCITCRIHGDFHMTATLHSSGGHGCHKCWRSQGEHIIASWLDAQCISYTNEHKFDDCLTPKGRKMKFDFYISSLNVLIEFDGEQHYYASDMFGGNESFERVKKYDVIKNQYAKRKGIRLIRIPFFKRSKIDEVLTSELLSSNRCGR